MREVEDAVAALRQSEERYRSLVEATAQVVWTTAPDGRLREDVPAWRAITGQSPDEVLGHGWLDAVHRDDRERVAAAWRRAVETNGSYDVQYRVRAADGGVRHLQARGVPVFDDGGTVREWVGTCTDVTASVEALAGERRAMEALQRSLLPGRLPDLPGVQAAARYLPGGPQVPVGGDWYDLFALPDRRVGLVMGDVAGRGVTAASVMSQTRAALRAYAVEGAPPGVVVHRLDELICHLELGDLTTLAYAVLDPASRVVSYASAGHLPPLVVAPGRAPILLTGARRAPLGAGVGGAEQALAELPPDGTLLLYTDGLVERRGRSLEEGIERLAVVAGAWDGHDLGVLCDAIMAGAERESERPDDVALLAVALIGGRG
jgi:PAS domain S-box-containing protein